MQCLGNIKKFSQMCVFVILLVSNKLAAQDMMRGSSSSMFGTMGWGGMIFGGVLSLAVIVALVALVLFLVRRSRTH